MNNSDKRNVTRHNNSKNKKWEIQMKEMEFRIQFVIIQLFQLKLSDESLSLRDKTAG